MYAFFCGKLVEKSAFEVILNVHGVGYKLHVQAHLDQKLPEIGCEVQLFASHVVREMSQTLYGFLHKEERDLFEQLLNFQGIGPKTALAIVAQYSPDELQQIVFQEDSKALSLVPGIGKKTAERLLIDLKGKLKVSSLPKMQLPRSSKLQDALNALMNLGYSQTHAEQAIRQAMDNQKEELDLAQLIAAALQYR